MCLRDGSLECFLRWSKSDQTGKSVTLFLHELRGSLMCPVQVFRTYEELRGTLPSSLLVHENGAFLSQFQFIQVWVKRIGHWESD